MSRHLTRLRRLQEHHRRCERRSEVEDKVRTDLEKEETVKLIQMMNRKIEGEQKEELGTCAKDYSRSDSSHDLEIDYVPSSSHSSEDEEVNAKPKFKKEGDKFKELDKTSLTQNFDAEKELMDGGKCDEALNKDCNPKMEDKKEDEDGGDEGQVRDVSQTDSEIFSEESLNDAQDLDEEVDVLTQRATSPGPSGDPKGTKKTGDAKGKRPKRTLRTAQDSDEELYVLTQRATSPGPSGDAKGTKKTGDAKGKRPKRALETAQDSDVEADIPSSDDPKMTEMKAMDQQPPNQEAISRRPWSAGEKSAVWRQLGQYITLQLVPGKDHCIKALQAEPILRSRSWQDVKNQVYNYITAQK